MKKIITILICLTLLSLSGCVKEETIKPLHINHSGDVYGSAEYLDQTVLIAGNVIPEEKTFSVAELEKLINENPNLEYSGYYSLMSSGGEFHYHEYYGIKLYEFLKYCGLDDSCAGDTPIKVVSVDGFSYEMKWEEIKNSTDNTYENKGDAMAKYSNVPKILAFASDGQPLVGPVGSTELGHVFTAEEGYIEEAENVGGPLRLVFGQKQPDSSNAPKNIQWVRQIIVGDDDYQKAHEEMLEAEQLLRSNHEIVIDETVGTWNHFNEPYSKHLQDELKIYGNGVKEERVYTLSDLESNEASTLINSFGASCGVNVYKGIKLKDIISENLKEEYDKPSKIYVESIDGYKTEINVDDVLNGVDSKYQLGENRDVIIAYAINGNPLVSGKDDLGFDGNNGSGSLQLVVENQISKWVKHVVAIEIDVD